MIPKLVSSKYLKIIIIFIVFFCSFYIRIKYFESNTILDADMSRDLMAGMHIVKYGEMPLVGHAASGIGFYYPPYYYYFVALLNLLTTNTVLLLKIFIFGLSFSAVFSFLIAFELFNIKTAVLTAFMEIFSYSRIMQQTNLYSSMIVSPVLLICTYLFIRFVRKKNIIFFVLCLFFLSLGSTVSYTLFPFIPFFLTMGFYAVKKLRNLKTLMKYLCGIILLNIILYSPLLFKLQLNNTWDHFNLFNHILISPDMPLKFIRLFITHFKGNFLKNPDLLIMVFFIHLLITLIRKKSISLFFFPFYLIIYILLLAAVKIEFVYSHYLYQIYPLYMMVFIAMVIYNQPFKQKVLNNILIIIQVFFITYSLININLFNYKYDDILQIFDTAKKILDNSEQVAKINSYDKLNFFVVYVYEPKFETWASTLVWYALEKQSGIRFVKYVNSGSNFEQINKDYLVYMICRGFEENQDKMCINDFELLFKNKYRYIKTINSSANRIHLFRNNQVLIKT